MKKKKAIWKIKERGRLFVLIVAQMKTEFNYNETHQKHILDINN